MFYSYEVVLHLSMCKIEQPIKQREMLGIEERKEEEGMRKTGGRD